MNCNKLELLRNKIFYFIKGSQTEYELRAFEKVLEEIEKLDGSKKEDK